MPAGPAPRPKRRADPAAVPFRTAPCPGLLTYSALQLLASSAGTSCPAPAGGSDRRRLPCCAQCGACRARNPTPPHDGPRHPGPCSSLQVLGKQRPPPGRAGINPRGSPTASADPQQQRKRAVCLWRVLFTRGCSTKCCSNPGESPCGEFLSSQIGP